MHKDHLWSEAMVTRYCVTVSRLRYSNFEIIVSWYVSQWLLAFHVLFVYFNFSITYSWLNFHNSPTNVTKPNGPKTMSKTYLHAALFRNNKTYNTIHKTKQYLWQYCVFKHATTATSSQSKPLCSNSANMLKENITCTLCVYSVVLCRDRFLVGRDKSRLGSKNRDGSRRDLRQRKT